MTGTLTVSGFTDTFSFDDEVIQTVHLPIVRIINNLVKESRDSGGRKVVVLLAGPPGSGKSTVAALWEALSKDNPELSEVQHLSIDGFFIILIPILIPILM